jgi:polyhydroxyalkanoate synthase
MRGKKRFLLGGSGHIAGIIIPPGSEKYGYYLHNACPKNPDDWLAKAHYHTGSWWPEWLTWLAHQSGRLIHAPVFAQLPMPGIMDAPGHYVHKSSRDGLSLVKF